MIIAAVSAAVPWPPSVKVPGIVSGLPVVPVVANCRVPVTTPKAPVPVMKVPLAFVPREVAEEISKSPVLMVIAPVYPGLLLKVTVPALLGVLSR